MSHFLSIVHTMHQRCSLSLEVFFWNKLSYNLMTRLFGRYILIYRSGYSLFILDYLWMLRFNLLYHLAHAVSCIYTLRVKLITIAWYKFPRGSSVFYILEEFLRRSLILFAHLHWVCWLCANVLFLLGTCVHIHTQTQGASQKVGKTRYIGKP